MSLSKSTEKSETGDAVLRIEVEEEERSSSRVSASPSFKGKLDLSAYGFSPQPSPTARASPRLALQKSASLPEPPIASSSNVTQQERRKRKSSSLAAPTPRKRKSSGYAPPSTYSHLPELPDTLEEGLICVFIGLNPGITTATTGHAYAHPSNYFWKLLYSSGLTPRKCDPSETSLLPSQFALGNTNIVSRPSRNGAELKQAELDAGVAVLEEKVAKFKPEAVCIVGKSIWESIWRVRHKTKLGKDFKYGWQGEGENMGVVEGWDGAKVFVTTTTSALAAGMSYAEKEKIWSGLGEWVKKRRVERARDENAPTNEDEECNS